MTFTRLYAYKRHLNAEFLKSQKLGRNLQGGNPNWNDAPINSTIVENGFEVLPFASCDCDPGQIPVNTSDDFPFSKFPIILKDSENETSFEKNVFSLILDLYGSMSVTKKLAAKLSTSIQENICKPLTDYIVSNLICEEDKEYVKLLSENVQLVFDRLNTEHKMKQLLKENKLYFEAEKFRIANEEHESKGYLFPLKENFKALFQSQPNLLLNMLLTYDEYFAFENGDEINNIITTPIWQHKSKGFNGKLILPILLYQDDIELNNPLGSKAGVQKISTMYVTFPLLDPLNCSKLTYHIPACLTLSSDLSAGLYSNFYYLALELKNLEETGICFLLYDIAVTVHFVVAAPVGDNLALNMVLGYNMTFIIDFFCRFCICTKEETEELTRELHEKLRINAGVLGETLGIKRECPFSKELNSFNILYCMSTDIVHDFHEGKIKLEMSNLINTFLDKGYFDLEYLNNAMKNFNQYSRFEKKNKCSKIKRGHLNNNILKMSASEVALFMKYFPIFVKEHIPSNDIFWAFFKLLYKLFNFVCQSSFTKEDLSTLANIIAEHHEMFINLKLGTKKNPGKLTPKHHIITHYPLSIRMLGPPKTFWVMRLEALHKKLKQYANVISSRRNILKSLSDKVQLNNSQLFFNNTKEIKVTKSKYFEYIILKNFKIENDYGTFPIEYSLPSYTFLSIENIKFEINDIVIIKKNTAVKIFKLKHLFYVSGIVSFFAFELNVLQYDEDLQLIEIQFPNQNQYFILKVSDIHFLPTNIKTYKNKYYVNISNF